MSTAKRILSLAVVGIGFSIAAGCVAEDGDGGVVGVYGDYGYVGPWYYHGNDWAGYHHEAPPFHAYDPHAVAHPEAGHIPSIPNAPRPAAPSRGGGGGHGDDHHR